MERVVAWLRDELKGRNSKRDQSERESREKEESELTSRSITSVARIIRV